MTIGYYGSIGDGDAEGVDIWAYSNMGQEVPRSWVVSMEAAREAVRHWALTRELSDKVTWEFS